MIDILVYLFENYQPDACPAPSVLAKKLSAAGFEADDISAALAWLEGLVSAEPSMDAGAGHGSVRIYDHAESSRLTVESRGFLTFLEHQEAIDPALRELIVERALALPGDTIGVDRLKVIVLTVIWRRQHAIDPLILEELLAEDDEDEDGTPDADTIRVLLN